MPFDFEQSSYLALRDAALPDTNRLVIWCGAGLSIPAGLPTWAGLRRTLENRLREKARHLDDGKEALSLDKRLESLQGNPSPWVAFGFLRDKLGHTTYPSAIRAALASGQTAPIPPAYLTLWRLRLAGMITLNLDPLPLRAYTEVHPGKHIVSFTGTQAGQHTHVLRNPNVPFLCHLHGQEEDASSWIFTHEDLKKLMEDEAYHTFLKTVTTHSTILFIGLSANDVAVGGHLAKLIEKKIDFGSHFWVTDHNDRETERWAEQAGIQAIYYRSSGRDHSQLQDMLDGLVSYLPDDDRLKDYPPVLHVPSLTPSTELAPPAEVRKMEPDEIRTILNQKALDILRPDNLNSEAEFEEFVAKYAYAIHNAWFVSTADGENELVGYKIRERYGRGAFGQIYKAVDPAGKPVAIKLVRDEIRTNPQLLRSFRRGVQAMRILSQRKVRGIVAYKQASEIPAFVVMDWVDGYDLRRALEMNLLTTWETRLQIALRIASILKDAHAVPERVLHRDLRPANIMLRARNNQDRPWDVVLLDFDLSWYLGSVEQSVIHGSDAFGYLAPEQVHPRAGASSRHPAVDSYGLGMTLYFMIAGVNPVTNQHLLQEWQRDVYLAAAQQRRSAWISIGKRYARLVLNLTHDRQTMRWDLAQVVLELKRLEEAVRHPNGVRAPDLLAEEVAARSAAFGDYTWDADTQSAVMAGGQAGMTMALSGNASAGRVELRVARLGTDGDKGWKTRSRMMEASRNLEQILVSGGWMVEGSRRSDDLLLLMAHCSVDLVAHDIDKAAILMTRVEKVIPRM